MKPFAASILAVSISGAVAAPLNGIINFGSTSPIRLDTSNFVTATGVDFQAPAGVPNAVVIPGATGDFAAYIGQTAIFQDFSFGSAVLNEWILPFSPGITFDLGTSVNFSVNNMFLNIAGTGTVHALGFDDTPGTFTLTATRSGSLKQIDFAFAASAATDAGLPPDAVPAPDGGATALMLGGGTLILAALNRRKTRA